MTDKPESAAVLLRGSGHSPAVAFDPDADHHLFAIKDIAAQAGNTWAPGPKHSKIQSWLSKPTAERVNHAPGGGGHFTVSKKALACAAQNGGSYEPW